MCFFISVIKVFFWPTFLVLFNSMGQRNMFLSFSDFLNVAHLIKSVITIHSGGMNINGGHYAARRLSHHIKDNRTWNETHFEFPLNHRADKKKMSSSFIRSVHKTVWSFWDQILLSWTFSQCLHLLTLSKDSHLLSLTYCFCTIRRGLQFCFSTGRENYIRKLFSQLNSIWKGPKTDILENDDYHPTFQLC